MNNIEDGGFFGKREFSVADMDKRCGEWMKKTPEEKEAFINERKEIMNSFRSRFHFFGHGRSSGSDECHENCMHDLRDKWPKMTDAEKKEFISKREDIMKNHEAFFDQYFASKESNIS